MFVTRQSFRIIDALSGSRFRYLGGQNRKPGWSGAGLFLKTARERVIDVVQPERAYGRAHQTRGGRCEDSVEERVVARYFVNAFCVGKYKPVTLIVWFSFIISPPQLFTFSGDRGNKKRIEKRLLIFFYL